MMVEDADSAEEVLRVDWSGADDMRVEPVNTFIVQAGPDNYVLNLGYVTPPVDVGPRSAPPKTLRVQVVGRILLTPGAVNALVTGLMEHARARGDEIGGKEVGDGA